MRIHDLLSKIGAIVLLGHLSAALGAEPVTTLGEHALLLRQGVWVWKSELTLDGEGGATAIRLQKDKDDSWSLTVARIALSWQGAKLTSVRGPIVVSTDGHILEYRTRQRRIRHTFRFERDRLGRECLILLPAYYGLAANHGVLPDGVSCPVAEQKRYRSIDSAGANIKKVLKEDLPGGIPGNPCDQYDYHEYDMGRV